MPRTRCTVRWGLEESGKSQNGGEVRFGRLLTSPSGGAEVDCAAVVRKRRFPEGRCGFGGAVRNPEVLSALDTDSDRYRLGSLRYDLSRLRARGLVEKVPKSRKYRFCAKGYSICLLFLKRFERIYAPLAAGLLRPLPHDQRLAGDKRKQLDRLYQRLTGDLDKLFGASGLRTAA